MKRVTITVQFVADIPNGVDPEDVCIDVDVDAIAIGTVRREQIGGEVLSYETVKVEE